MRKGKGKRDKSGKKKNERISQVFIEQILLTITALKQHSQRLTPIWWIFSFNYWPSQGDLWKQTYNLPLALEVTLPWRADPLRLGLAVFTPPFASEYSSTSTNPFRACLAVLGAEVLEAEAIWILWRWRKKRIDGTCGKKERGCPFLKIESKRYESIRITLWEASSDLLNGEAF